MNTQNRPPEVAADLMLQTDFGQPNKRGRRPARATQADIRRAIAAAATAATDGSSFVVEVLPTGTIRIFPTRAETPKLTGNPPPAPRQRIPL